MFLFDSENIHFRNHWHEGLPHEPELLLFFLNSTSVIVKYHPKQQQSKTRFFLKHIHWTHFH